MNSSQRLQVVVLAPMPLEMAAIARALGLERAEGDGDVRTGNVGGAEVTAVHIGMGPPRTRAALHRLFDEADAGGRRVDHVMVAGICGGLDPNRPVGTIICPEWVVDHATGAAYRHHPPAGGPPAGGPPAGRLVTTEEATLDHDLSRRLFADGCWAVDMESAAVAEVCEARRCPWSVYRCIGDRYVDGLLDERVLAATNPDGSGDAEAIARLLAEEPEVGAKLERLARETSTAAALAAEAAREGCLALAP